MNWVEKLQNTNFNYARNGRKFIIAPVAIFLVALILFFIPGVGFNLGLDFTGGAIITVNETAEINEKSIREKMDTYNITYEVRKEQNTNRGGNTYAIKFNAKDNTADVLNELEDYYGGYDGNVVSSGLTSAQTSQEKIMTVFWSVLAACAGLLIYMLFRFKITAGIATLLALAHDVIMICALMIIFHIEINTSFIAAILTVIAYSINNSLVIFDRVRDLEKHNPDNLSLEQILNKSINRTLGRCVLTIATTLATLITLTVVSIVMNLPTLIQFALPIILGLVAGTYSSLFLISPMYLQFETARIVSKQRKKNNIH